MSKILASAIMSVLVVLTFIVLVFSPPARAPDAETAAENRNFDAYWNCRQFVSQRLKAPASADFASLNESTVMNAGGGVFTVHTYVDAQNSWGAKLRSQCRCEMHNPGKDDWRLLDISVE
jgi:hypothetical protein